MCIRDRHIIGEQPFSSPYQYIAADVNGNKQVSMYDVVLMFRVILGVLLEWQEPVPVWRFVDSNTQFSDFTKEWTQPNEFIEVQQVAETPKFIGIKTGDVNGKWRSLSASESRQSDSDQVPVAKWNKAILILAEYLQEDLTHWLKPTDSDLNLFVFPNPSDGVGVTVYTQSKSTDTILRLVDAAGRVVYEVKQPKPVEKIDGQYLVIGGAYFLVLENEGQRVSEKLIINR